MIEMGPITFIYGVLKDLWHLFRGRKRRLDASDIIEAKRKWKDEFESKISKRRKEHVGLDVIIHDMKRLDQYPSTEKNGKGISPWFKVGLMDTYHGGILAGLRWGRLTLDENQWRYIDRQNGEEGDVSVILIGFIPYENIEHVD